MREPDKAQLAGSTEIGRPWGRCVYTQHLVLPWCAVLRNEGLATAKDVRFQVICASSGVTWAALDVKMAGSGVQRFGHGLTQPSYLVPTFRTVGGPRGDGRVLDDVHPGQEVIIANGEIVIPAESFPVDVPDLSISGFVFSLDTPQTELRAEIRKSRIVTLLQPVFDHLGPAIRVLPEPPSWLDADHE